MSLNRWTEMLWNMQADGPAITNTTPLSLIGAVGTGQPKYTLPSSFFDQAGKGLLIEAAGRVSNIVTTPGTLTLDVRFGAVIVANGGAMSLNIVAKTNVPWMLRWLLTARTIGSGTVTTLIHQGTWVSESVIGSPLPTVGGAGMAMLPNAAPVVGTGFDSSATQQVDLFATWSINNAGNTLTMHQMGLFAVN